MEGANTKNLSPTFFEKDTSKLLKIILDIFRKFSRKKIFKN